MSRSFDDRESVQARRFFEDAQAAVSEMLGAPTYARDLMNHGELVAEWSTGDVPRAEFDLLGGGRLLLGLDSSRNLSAMLRALGGGELPRLGDLEVAALRTELMVLLHELIHSVGPGDPRVAEDDWWTAFRYGHARVACEGGTQLAAETFLDEFIDRLGLGAVEPRLHVDRVLLHPYAGETAAVRVIVRQLGPLAHPLPKSASEEERALAFREALKGLVTAGTGDRPVAQLVRRVMDGQSLTRLNRPAVMGAFGDLCRAIDVPLDGLNVDHEARGSAERGAAYGEEAVTRFRACLERSLREVGPYPELREPKPTAFSEQRTRVRRPRWFLRRPAAPSAQPAPATGTPPSPPHELA